MPWGAGARHHQDPRGVDVGFDGISSSTYERIGTGQVSDCYRIFFAESKEPNSNTNTLTSPPPAQQHRKPSPTAILKVASTSATSRRASLSLSLYEREVRFYSEPAPCIGARHDGAARASLAYSYHSSFRAEDGSFCLLLADAGADAVVGDDIAGATLAQARTAMAALGRLQRVGRDEQHRTEWKGKKWLNRGRQIDQSRLRALYGGEVREKLVGVFNLFAEGQRAEGKGRIQGLVHGDYRLDDMLFAAEEGVREREGTVSWGPAMSDVASFLGTALGVERGAVSRRDALPWSGFGSSTRWHEAQCSSSSNGDDARKAVAGKTRELTKHAVLATSCDARDELPVASDIELETEREQDEKSSADNAAAPLKLHLEARGHGPLRLVDPVSTGNGDGEDDVRNGDARSKPRVALFPRAWGTVTTSDGRRGVAWVEWNRGAGGGAIGTV
ncbi:uncharacterized protein IWZ02DRAFT_485138 [Phyllosticta citriasiana]|uniref:uncharacterized protein n=1 Tax=Phyllosticta citriasiana TaxID=595635 RepID=UPI0030FD9ECF